MTRRKQAAKDVTGLRQHGGTYRLLIDSFIRPTLGDMPISRLCRFGPRPFEQLYAELPSTLPRPDLWRAPHALTA